MYFSKPIRQQRKYKNVPTAFRGEGYDSKAEVYYAMELESKLRGGEIKRWEKQKTLELVVNGYLICTYKIDFIVYHLDETTEYIEVKGFATPAWRLKWKLFEALYSDKPNVKLTVAWTGNQVKMRKKKSITYTGK